MSEKIRVLIAGVCGRMGQETARAVFGAEDMEIVGACDAMSAGCTLTEAVAGVKSDAKICNDLAEALKQTKPDVLIDFTSPSVVMGNIRIGLAHKVPVVVGTTGISQDDLEELRALSAKTGTPVLIAPNFAIGAVLMMKFAAEAAKYMPSVEIIELHHDKKLDAPSGTAIKTAELISKTRGEFEKKSETFSARGDEHFDVRVHSVRLPGLVAHQEVIFGGQGQTLTIRHDSLDRTSFMPGVLLATRKVRNLTGVVYGLDNIL